MRLYVKPSTLLLTMILLFILTILIVWNLLFPAEQGNQDTTNQTVTISDTETPYINDSNTFTESDESRNHITDKPTTETRYY